MDCLKDSNHFHYVAYAYATGQCVLQECTVMYADLLMTGIEEHGLKLKVTGAS